MSKNLYICVTHSLRFVYDARYTELLENTKFDETQFTQEVNLRQCISCKPLPSTNKAAHSGFENQRRCHQKSKTRVSVGPTKSTYVLKKNFKKI